MHPTQMKMQIKALKYQTSGSFLKLSYAVISSAQCWCCKMMTARAFQYTLQWFLKSTHSYKWIFWGGTQRICPQMFACQGRCFCYGFPDFCELTTGNSSRWNSHQMHFQHHATKGNRTFEGNVRILPHFYLSSILSASTLCYVRLTSPVPD